MPEKKTVIITLTVMIVTVSMFHYLTPTSYHPLHELYKVLYFIPILLAAFGFGLRGGILTALIVTAIYVPHVMFQWGGDFIMNISRFFMIFLYNTIGALTGYLWEQERKQRQFYQDASLQLEASYKKLQQTSTELSFIENQLRTAERLSTLGELTASLAHEVRNPLGSIRGVAEILRDEPKTTDHQKFVDILLKETQRLDQVVANYLSFARQQPGEMTNVNIRKIIESTLTLLGPEIRKKALVIETIPEKTNLTCWIQEGQMRQALINVLLNAIQASPDQGKISINVQHRNNYLEFQISDQGPGLSKEAQQRLFEPFYTEKEDGTGLGLAITKRIVESMGGKINAQNNPDNGTTISLLIQTDHDTDK